jgi:CubicO group peptidase (beta-lactamase class C family)
MVTRHGHVVAEGWWAPYRRDAIHSLYSLSKSFTSTAVGFAVAEGKLSLSERVIKFFPGKLPPKVTENLAALSVEHLLTMSVGHTSDPTQIMTKEDDWVKTFLSVPIEHTPGSVFSYNTAATYMLSAIVQTVSAQRVIDYLESRLFAPLEIHEKQWERCPHGVNTGGWGLSVTTDALAKFGQFYLQSGKWNGKQLLPPEWIEKATSSKIQQPATWNAIADPGVAADPDNALERLKKISDWYQGYGYQFWRCCYGAFRGDGAFGQYCIAMPEKDAVIVITGRTTDMQGLLDLVWKHLLPAMHDEALPDAAAAGMRLKRELASLALPLPSGAPTSASMGTDVDKSFRLEPNSLNAESVSFNFRGESCLFALKTRKGTSELRCAIGKWEDGVTDMPGVPPKFITVSDWRPVKVTAAGSWKDEDTFEMQWRFYETPHYDTVTCRFDGDRVRIEFLNSIAQFSEARIPETRPVLKGRIFA